MSLYGMMRTGVSGMGAQSNRLSTVADNIANSNTTGYKRASAEFSSLVMQNTGSSYSSGAVQTTIRHAISQEGLRQFTTSSTDLAINGEGFFVVQDTSGASFLTRAGSFVPNDQGQLVNAAGFYLTGYPGGRMGAANGFDGLQRISIADSGMTVAPSTAGQLALNLPSGDETTDPDRKTSLVVVDSLGEEKVVDIFFSKTANLGDDIVPTDPANPDATYDHYNWTVRVEYDGQPILGEPDADGNASPIELELQFNETGQLVSGTPPIQFTIPGAQEISLDFSGSTQLASEFDIHHANVNGQGPSSIEEVRIGEDGVVSALYKNGDVRNLYQIALASVESPDRLSVLPGNVFSPSPDSGDVTIGMPGVGAFGQVVSGALEGSNVDIAEELTNMIESQRNYTANSKVFQTGSELLDVLVNLR